MYQLSVNMPVSSKTNVALPNPSSPLFQATAWICKIFLNWNRVFQYSATLNHALAKILGIVKVEQTDKNKDKNKDKGRMSQYGEQPEKLNTNW